MLTHRHEVVVVRVVDPVELELPDLGLILVEDAETGEQLLVDTSDPLLRGAWPPRSRPARTRWPTRCAGPGWSPTGSPPTRTWLGACRHGAAVAAEAPMSFLLSARARRRRAGDRGRRRRRTSCSSGGAPRRWRPRPGLGRAASRRRGACAGTCRTRCSSPPCRCCWSAWPARRPTIAVPRVAGTVMLAFDVSNSMAADDVEPTRLAAAQAAADRLRRGAAGHRRRRRRHLRPAGADHPGADRRPRRGASRRSTGCATGGGTSLGQAILAALSHDHRQAGRAAGRRRRRAAARPRLLALGDDRGLLRRRGDRRAGRRGGRRPGRRRRGAHRDGRGRHRRRRHRRGGRLPARHRAGRGAADHDRGRPPAAPTTRRRTPPRCTTSPTSIDLRSTPTRSRSS